MPSALNRESRRAWLGGLVGWSLGGWLSPLLAQPAEVAIRDAAGRAVRVPQPVRRVFPAGGPAAILVYTLAPDLLLGWPRANRAAELPFLLPGVGDRPELGRLTGRGNTANLEQLLTQRPGLIVDSGSTRDTYVDLANRVQAQTNIPYLLLDGRFEQIAAMYRLLGRALGREARAETLADHAESTLAEVRTRLAAVPATRRPRVYYARGPQGLETGLGGSINAEILDWMGLRHFGEGRPGGLARVSVEEVLAWDPEVIVTIDRAFAETVREQPLWRRVSAVRANRVHLSPKLPFGWIDFPPSVNRLPGLWWLGQKVYPDAFDQDLVPLTRNFYRLFYQVEPSAEQIRQVLAGRD